MEYGFVGVLYLVENLYLLSRFSESVIAGIGVFEAIDNFPEVICVGFSFLVTTVLGEKVGKRISMSLEEEGKTADGELADAAKRLTKGGILGSMLIVAALLLLARPLTGLFLTGDDPMAVSSAVWLTVSCALGFVFYMLNSELVCYYKIVGAYGQAHVLFFAEALLFPLGFKLLLGELFGVVGFCLGGFAGELAAFLLNLCLVWKAAGHFPKRLSDSRMDKYLLRQTQAQSESRAET
jgi:Na+-driven multidrug efflux pump